MTKNEEKGKFGNRKRLAKSCFSEANEDSDSSSSNSEYSMEDRSLDNRMDGKEGKRNEISGF